ncbi:MAG TPA: M2 family metallopeptidase [Vicinamibacterales bacterium]|nr:M2 family metallopeptidase [Vicinamibacterales bacterium]
MTARTRTLAILIVLGLSGFACTVSSSGDGGLGAASCSMGGGSTQRPVAEFLADANATLLKVGNEASQASWVYSTYITQDTEVLNARANQAFIEAGKRFAKEAASYDKADVTPEQRRQLNLLKLALEVVTPTDPKEAEELTRLAASLEATYGKGKWCKDARQEKQPDACLDIEKITDVLAKSRNEKEIREAWEGWHTISVPMRKDYARFVELANKGAKELGFADTGAMWRLKYDMPADDFTMEVDRLWDQVRPLYVSLHAYVRMKLHEKYGDAVPATGPIPAHMLGNIWAQDWSNVFDLVATGGADSGYSLTKILEQRKTSAVDMMKMGERFYTSLGLAPLPKTFWERSLLVKPRDRDVVCHASAWDIDSVEDVRIKMCVDPTEEDFSTIHHELGHNYYYRAYKDQPFIFRDSANQAFHEAIGDTIALSVTPEYLVKIGLLDKAPDTSRDIGLLMSRALEKIAFLPFGLVIDQWRWDVYNGKVAPADYNKAWWERRLKYQGVAPPSTRGEEFFDPGAKYHVPANYSYTRYFLAHILQFQFHRELSKIAGCTTPLHRCSIYDSKAAGQKLEAMLKMGTSRPWPDALEALTGKRQMDATAIVDYFAPLKAWLDAQTKGKSSGW